MTKDLKLINQFNFLSVCKKLFDEGNSIEGSRENAVKKELNNIMSRVGSFNHSI